MEKGVYLHSFKSALEQDPLEQNWKKSESKHFFKSNRDCIPGFYFVIISHAYKYLFFHNQSSASNLHVPVLFPLMQLAKFPLISVGGGSELTCITENMQTRILAGSYLKSYGAFNNSKHITCLWYDLLCLHVRKKLYFISCVFLKYPFDVKVQPSTFFLKSPLGSKHLKSTSWTRPNWYFAVPDYCPYWSQRIRRFQGTRLWAAIVDFML